MSEMTPIRAINQALSDEMARDERVLVIGEDVAEGGPYGATRGLVDAYGPSRVRDTPISEGTVMGLAIGLALAGLRPVVEIMFIDFITLALDQLTNQAAKARYMSGGQLRVPLVVRTQGGAGVRSGAQHSQSLEVWLAHVPGLTVAVPATAADAGGLLLSAIRTDDPVVLVENKAIYYRRESVDEPLAPVPLGRAAIRRRGSDVTVIATSRLVAESLAAADDLARESIDVEVIDARTIQPLDEESILGSVGRTGRCVIAHEAVRPFGIGAEIAALVQEKALDRLQAPVLRVAPPFTPIPVSPPLEDAYLVGRAEVAEAVREVMAW